MRRIWRSTRDLLRFDRFTNMASSLPWRAASLAAMRSSSPRIASTARATSPISSGESTSTDSRSDGAFWHRSR